MTHNGQAFLGGLTAEEFLRDYWQKKPLLVRGAFPEIADLLTPDDLKELSMEEGIEARIIEEFGKTPWALSKGPFTAKTFRQLPQSHWTLLVQAVDHYLPTLSDALERFRFIPSWRIDDVMISYAVPGGSVGPHYDRYDVFLIQGVGQRRWQIGPQVDEQAPRLPHPSLRLLSHMEVEEDTVLNPGDMLYLPPFAAHYGTAVTDCLTYSIGFRAPQLSQVLERLVDAALEQPSAKALYTDPDLASQENRSGELSTASLNRLRSLVMELLDDEAQFADVAASLLSEPKYEDYEPAGESFSGAMLLQAMQGGQAVLIRDPASRFLYLRHQDGPRCYINGHPADPDLDSLILKQICDQRILYQKDVASLSETAIATLLTLLAQGLLLWVEVD